MTKDSTVRGWEQLWGRKVEETRFEICCIPFFVYDLALGDEVETQPDGEKKYAITRVLTASGHSTFRVWFGDSSDTTIRETLKEINHLGCLMEFYSKKLLGVDAESHSQAQAVENLLYERQQLRHLFPLAKVTLQIVIVRSAVFDEESLITAKKRDSWLRSE